MKEITKVTMVGALDREIQINVDMFKMQAATISMYDIYKAVHDENMNISGGLVPMDGMKEIFLLKHNSNRLKKLKI